MVTLKNEVKLSSTGIPDLSAKLVKRSNDIAMYKRSDEVIEVSKVKVTPEGMVFDTFYPERESYPSNEDFGNSAWCYRDQKKADRKYSNLVSGSIHV